MTDPTPSAHCACHCAVCVAQATSAPVVSPTPSAPAAAPVPTPIMPYPWGIGLGGNPPPAPAPPGWSPPAQAPLFIRFPYLDEVCMERARVRARQLERLIVVNQLFVERSSGAGARAQGAHARALRRAHVSYVMKQRNHIYVTKDACIYLCLYLCLPVSMFACIYLCLYVRMYL
jgi:hypothetical protein